MNLRLIRRWPKAHCTIGELLVDGEYQCFTLEDQLREDPDPSTPENEAKVPGRTAIPAGRYRLVITHSQRFDRDLPLLMDVPGFTGIRIHAGNTEGDTQGCILVGRRAYENSIGESRAALEALMSKLRLPVKDETWITIEDTLDPTLSTTSGAPPEKERP